VLVAIGLSDLAAIHAGVVLSLGCYLLAIWWFASALGLRGWRRALLLALATGVGNTYLQVTNGLETGFALAAIVAAIAAAYEVRIGAAAMFAGVLPWLRPVLGLIGGAILIAILWEHPRQWRRVFFIPLVIALPWALWALLDTGHLIPNTVNAKRVDQNVPADARIATHDAGVLSLTGRPLIDLVGLKTPSTIAAHTRWTWSTCGADRWQAFRAVLTSHPADYLVVTNRWNRQFHITEAANAGRALRSTSALDDYAVFELPSATSLLSPP